MAIHTESPSLLFGIHKQMRFLPHIVRSTDARLDGLGQELTLLFMNNLKTHLLDPRHELLR